MSKQTGGKKKCKVDPIIRLAEKNKNKSIDHTTDTDDVQIPSYKQSDLFDDDTV